MRLLPLEIPNGVTVEIEGNKVKVKGPKGEVVKTFKSKGLKIEIIEKDGKKDVKVESPNKVMINTVRAHIKNMLKGVTESFQKKMIIRYSHFPIKVSIKGDEVVIENFLGERSPRKTKIIPPAKVTVKGQFLTVEGPDAEAVGQTAANIREVTKIRNKDIRIFQDGIYYVIEGE